MSVKSDSEGCVQWPHENLGAKYNNFGGNDVKYKQLDFRGLIAGELNIIINNLISKQEKQARLKMLGDIVFNTGFYQWSAILKLHAAILSEIEDGVREWGDDYSRLEQQMLMPFPLNKSAIKQDKIKAGNFKIKDGVAKSEDFLSSDNRVLYCAEFNRKKCLHSEPHSALLFGKSVTVQHICAVCWQKNQVKAYHPKISNECPNAENWLEKGTNHISDQDSWRYSVGQSNISVNVQKDYISLVEVHEFIKKTRLPNFQGAKIILDTKLNIPFIEAALKDYHDKVIVEFCKYGWPIGITNIDFPKSLVFKNHKGATDYANELDKYIAKEVEVGTLLGPFDDNPFKSEIVISPLNTTEKKDSVERRVIMDLSFPHGNSVNDRIPKDEYLGEEYHLRFPSIDELVELVKEYGRGCALMKRDLKKAYKQILVDPGDWNFLGLKWNGKLYFDRTLPMGLRSSAMCCQRITNAVKYIFEQLGYKVVPYLDDLGSAAKWSDAKDTFDQLGDLLIQVGLTESVNKACEPSTKMLFLGVLFDTDKLTLKVSDERLDEIMMLLQEWIGKTHANRKEIQSIIGKLSFVSACVRPGRLFVSRMLEFLRGLPNVGKFPIPESFKQDLLWWRKFLPLHNGVSMMALEEWSQPDEIFSTDACLTGCGAWCASVLQYFHMMFPSFIPEQNLSINCLELLTIVVAAKIWGKLWSGKRIVVHCDNEVSVKVLNTGRGRNHFLLACLRELELVAARHGFEIRGHHIPGVENRIPDCLSRWNLSDVYETKFREQVKGLHVQEIFVFEGLFKFMHEWWLKIYVIWIGIEMYFF